MLVTLVCQESMFDDIRADVARSYTKLPPRQSILVDITPTYIQPYSIIHSSLPLHLYLLPFPSPFFLDSGIPFSSYARTSSASSVELSLPFIPLSVTLVIQLFHSLSCRALQLRTSIVPFIFLRHPIYFPLLSSVYLPVHPVLVIPVSCTASHMDRHVHFRHQTLHTLFSSSSNRSSLGG